MPIVCYPPQYSRITATLYTFTGDNSDIVATDSQKNTVYLLAKQHGVRSPEEFALLLVNHFLTKYRHVAEAHVYIEEYPWKRVTYERHAAAAAKAGPAAEHNHAFVFTPVARRYCDVLQKRNGESVKYIQRIYTTIHTWYTYIVGTIYYFCFINYKSVEIQCKFQYDFEPALCAPELARAPRVLRMLSTFT